MMKWRYFILLQIVLVAIVGALIYSHQDKATLIKTPPKALAQWYKPENKRQVWLHNMFKLRREMQAVQFYAQQQNSELLSKWSSGLKTHYLKISEMIPSWEKKLDKALISSLEQSVADKNYSAVIEKSQQLQQNCDSCHNDYQAITALTYRAPDFTKISMSESESFIDHMEKLSQQVNQIKIASEDGMPELALTSLAELTGSMDELGQVCTDCHKQDKKPYPSEQMKQTMVSLEQNLKTGTLKQQGRDLGTLAVLACARCHGSHRLVFGAKQLLSHEPTMAELMKH